MAEGGGADLELGAEWLHNRLDLICSLPDWGNPSRDPAWDRARMWRALISLFRRKSLTSDGVLDPIVDLDEAPGMFMSIYRNAIPSVKMGIRFDR
ncbi:MAG: hypothetical protein AMXMBFR7_42950 [Planctomycetota bacterium]